VLTFGAVHAENFGALLITKTKSLDVIEALAEMFLNGSWLSSLAHDLKELVVGEEEEAWEDFAFGLEELLQVLLYTLEDSVTPLKHCEYRSITAHVKHVLAHVGLGEQLLELSVNRGELGGFFLRKKR
jgi:hypothetical protein